jgi:hypothetical protein
MSPLLSPNRSKGGMAARIKKKTRLVIGIMFASAVRSFDDRRHQLICCQCSLAVNVWSYEINAATCAFF